MNDKAFLIHGVMLVHHQMILEAVMQSHVAASISLDSLYSFVVVLLYKNFPSLFFLMVRLEQYFYLFAALFMEYKWINEIFN